MSRRSTAGTGGGRPAQARRGRPARGFTLIEVLVALVIVALGMSALMETVGSAGDSLTWLREKTFAQWIAFNQLTLTRLAAQLPTTGTTDGELDFAGQHWHWRQEVTDLGFPGMLRIDVKVQPADTATVDDNHWMATVTGAVGDAVAPAQLQSEYPEPALPGQPGPGSQPAPSPAPSSAPSSAPQDSLLSPANTAPASQNQASSP